MDSLIQTKRGATDGPPLRAVSGYIPNELEPSQSSGVAGSSGLSVPHDCGAAGKTLNVISLGAGVQSSMMALAAGCRTWEELPMPDMAIFADTKDEPASVYKWLDWLEHRLRDSFPIVRVSKGRLSQGATKVHTSRNGIKYTNSNIPVFLKMPGTDKEGLQSRQCTADYKIRVIQSYLRKTYGRKVGRRIVPPNVVMWIGISRDEWHRMKPSKEPWIKNIFPLVDHGVRRQQCLKWMEEMHNPMPPRSACVFCPYHGDAEWLRLKNEEPREFARACVFEKRYQGALAQVPTIKGKPFLHRSLTPLGEIDFAKILQDEADEDAKQPDFFGSECEGMCGV